MGLFEDLKAAKEAENAEMETLKQRFDALNRVYQSALTTIETLKSEQIAMEDSHREELNTAAKEINSLKSAFVAVMNELKHANKQKAAITANRNYWKQECKAVGMLYKLTDEELQELKNKTHKPAKLKIIEAKNTGPLRIAAAIGK